MISRGLGRALARRWALVWRGTGAARGPLAARGDEPGRDVAQARRRFWAELRAGQLEAEERSSKGPR